MAGRPATGRGRVVRGVRSSRRGAASWAWLLGIALAGLACLLLGPWWASGGELPVGAALSSGLLSDDGAALGYVHREGAFADWFRSEYDLRTVRFWRPLVTTSLGLQESLGGALPWPLRLFNLAGHLGSALLVALIVRRLGAGWSAAGLAGLVVALYPHQGGNVVWVVGRVDSQCVPLVLLAVLFVLDGKRWAAAAAFLGAAATKELAVATPALAFGFALLALWSERGRGWTPAPLVLGSVASELVRRLWPMALAFVAVVVWRRAALGVWVGGYPSAPGGAGISGDLGEVSSLAGRWAGHLAEVSPALLIAVAVVLPVSTLLAWRRARSAVVAPGARAPEPGPDGADAARAGAVALPVLALAAVATVPLYHLWLQEELPREHARTFFLADAVMAVALGCALGAVAGSARGGVRTGVEKARLAAVLLVGLAVCGARASAAAHDLERWVRAGVLAEAELEVARTALALAHEEAGAVPSEPLLLEEPTRSRDGAYVLHWGVTDRFRPPFLSAPRPVWPWRPMFDLPGLRREPACVRTGTLLWPDRGLAPDTAPLELRIADGGDGGDGSAPEVLVVSDRLTDEPGPLLQVNGAPAGAILEVLFVTEMGYGVGLVGAAPSEGLGLSLRDLLFLEDRADAGGAIALWQVLAQAADLGAREAWIEVRAVASDAGASPGGAPGASPLAASRWVRVVWDRAVRDVLLPRDAFD